LRFSRADLRKLAPALAGLVLAVDLLWSLLVGSTGSLAYGLVDEPAHLATAAVGLAALLAVARRWPSRRFLAAALVASVAIDVDHIPGYLGSHALAGALPRPYPHSLLLIAVLLSVAWASPRRDLGQISLGAAFGVGAHLLRDLATGPGVPLLWPFTDGVSTMPYAVFAALLGAGALVSLRGQRRMRPRLVGAVAVAALLTVAAAVAAERPGTALAAGPPPVALGAYIPGAGEDPSLIDAYGYEVGRDPAIVSSYKDWTRPLIDPEELAAVWSHGAVPMITWEPWDQHHEGSYWPLSSIAAGQYDPFIAESARAAAAWGNPILLRFAHEMNGGWYPWGRNRNGNTPAAYKAAWRHVVSVFRAAGAVNVKWVWTPYVLNGHSFPFRRYYPGDRWVDWAGVDGLNGGSVFGWRSFSEIFEDSYRQLIRITPRPLIIAEVGSTESGGHKAVWLSRALRRSLPRMPDIRALVWWADATDYRGNFGVDSSPAALGALRSAMALPRYRSSRALFLKTPRNVRTAHRRPGGRCRPRGSCHGRRAPVGQ
jgi:mannan endo-1,4-beta-mannosidase